MRVSWKSEAPQWALLAACLAIGLYSLVTSPDTVPVHWGIDGQVDRFGSRYELLALPAIGVAVYLLMLFLPRFDPGRENYARFAGAYSILRLAILGLLTGLYAVIAVASHDPAFNPMMLLGALLGVFFIVLGALMGRLRPTYFTGIRTPWTLTSERAWDATHRVGGWVFGGLGVVTLVCALGVPALTIFVLAGGALLGVLGLTVYSYLVWRADPDRHPPFMRRPAGT
jgi:uncharacterized membrane protein